ncbi:MAG: sodium:solute symporter [Prevotella sp.]|nr:sodium:solute symporter [Prevotella sp.]
MIIVITIIAYFALLMGLSRWTARRSGTNEAFFRGNRQSPWYVVAFGMVGASISGVTFVSVPGMVLKSDMTYLQTCMGFILGYFVVAFVLLPVYYRLNLTTIYSYLHGRLGLRSYRTGASFFLLSKITGAAVRFYLVCMIICQVLGVRCWVLGTGGVTSQAVGSYLFFLVVVVVMVALIWLYTRRSGIKTIVWTDTLQTACMLLALVLIIYNMVRAMDMSLAEAVGAVAQHEHSRVFVWDDWVSRQNFWKQFLSGIFIVVVMTGLDQDMMQKNLTCRSLRDAQKDMCVTGFAFVPVNLLFMALGVLLVIMAQRQGVALPENGDELLPMFAATGQLGITVQVLFAIGIVAASFSSADSALTALTTSFCVDICGRKDDERLRRRVHVGMAVVFVAFVLMFRMLGSTSVIDAVYILCSYTYGPLLGLFAFGLLTRKKTNDRYVPYIAVASPVICLVLNHVASTWFGYRFGYELLMLNGLLTFVMLWLCAPARQ